MIRVYPEAGDDPGMIGFFECPLTRQVLTRSWCQTVLMVMGLPITERRSGHADHKVYVF